MSTPQRYNDVREQDFSSTAIERPRRVLVLLMHSQHPDWAPLLHTTTCSWWLLALGLELDRLKRSF